MKGGLFPSPNCPAWIPVGAGMRSTGEAMGLADSFGMAFAKEQIAAEGSLPLEGRSVTVNDHDKQTLLPIAAAYTSWGFGSWRRRAPNSISAAAVCGGAGAESARRAAHAID